MVVFQKLINDLVEVQVSAVPAAGSLPGDGGQKDSYSVTPVSQTLHCVPVTGALSGNKNIKVSPSEALRRCYRAD